MQHRNDIDGLRAIAIGAVVLAHFWSRGFPAGVVGVDIFFVISGYLITRMILGDLGAGHFSLADFYRRRVVRILPALLVMIIVVLALGALLLLPNEIASVGWSAAAAATFWANFHFWSDVGYFESQSMRPLLHSWSLGVEEQFYLIYPLFVMVLHRWLPRYLRACLWIATLGSFAFGWLLCVDHPAAGFYMLPARGWELGLGALVAAGGFPAVPRGRASEAVAAAGLVLLIGGLIYATRLPGFPTPAALPVCAGAALLLAAGEGSFAARLLGLAPMRWLGLRSYALYLWHWPLLVLWPLFLGQDPDEQVHRLPVLIAALVATELSWRFVETPVRRRFRAGGSPGRIVAIGVAASVLVAAIALLVAANADRIRQVPAPVGRVLAYADYKNGPEFAYQHGPVHCYGGTVRYRLDLCLRFDPARRNVVVLGDSHAAHLWRAIAERFPQDNVMEAASTRCRPVLGGTGGRLCLDMFERVMREAVAARKVQGVVLSGAWLEFDIAPLARTVRAIRAKGIDVTVLGPSLFYDGRMPTMLARAMLKGDPEAVGRRRNPAAAALDPLIERAVTAAGARYYSLYRAECPGGRCRLFTQSGAPYLFDSGHFTLEASRELVRGMPRP